ncbi:hypothetical protein [Proteus mirabilis]|uniref:hypothetical protein n=1 Tax=Proteus mirabilis TaxID=584 RepID=UPI0034D3E999
MIKNLKEFMTLYEKNKLFYSKEDAELFFRSLQLVDVRNSVAIFYNLIKTKYGLYNFSKTSIKGFDKVDRDDLSISMKEKLMDYSFFCELFVSLNFPSSSSLSGEYLISDICKLDEDNVKIRNEEVFHHFLFQQLIRSSKVDFINEVKKRIFNFDSSNLGNIIEMIIISNFLTMSTTKFSDNDIEGLLYEVSYKLEGSINKLKFVLGIIEAEQPNRTFSSFSNYTLFSIYSKYDFNQMMNSIDHSKVFSPSMIEMFKLI